MVTQYLDCKALILPPLLQNIRPLFVYPSYPVSVPLTGTVDMPRMQIHNHPRDVSVRPGGNFFQGKFFFKFSTR